MSALPATATTASIGLRRLAAGVALALAVFAGVAQTDSSAAAGDGAAAASCPPSHARVLQSGRMAVAYQVGYEAYACYRPTGRRFDLGDLASDPGNNEGCADDVDLVRVAGRYAAWAHGDFCYASSRFHVFRRDLRSGRRLRGEPTGTRSCPATSPNCGNVGIGRASALVLTRHASIAWIATDGDTAEVWRFDGRGRRRLAAGSDIDLRFLHRRDRRVEWRKGGVVHQASLRP
jgi:hypothetical protein